MSMGHCTRFSLCSAHVINTPPNGAAQEKEIIQRFSSVFCLALCGFVQLVSFIVLAKSHSRVKVSSHKMNVFSLHFQGMQFRRLT